MQSKHEYINILKAKGWSVQELASRWGGVRRETIYRTARNPTQKDWDALKGLEDRANTSDSRDVLDIAEDLAAGLRKDLDELAELIRG